MFFSLLESAFNGAAEPISGKGATGTGPAGARRGGGHNGPTPGGAAPDGGAGPEWGFCGTLCRRLCRTDQSDPARQLPIQPPVHLRWLPFRAPGHHIFRQPLWRDQSVSRNGNSTL